MPDNLNDEWLATWRDYPHELIYGDDDYKPEPGTYGTCDTCYGEYGDGWSNCTCDEYDEDEAVP